MDLQEEKGPVSVIYPHVYGSVGPGPNMDTATIVDVSFVFMFFLATLLLWNAAALIKSQTVLPSNL